MQGTQGLKPYRTIRENSETETVIQRSRFLARCLRIDAEADAVKAIEAERKRFYDARHHCYAWRIGESGMYTRSSDDGEPSGTAGAPILNVLTANDVTNVLCVVTRYFGGILLGTGGLTRAYGGAATSALEAAGILCMQPGTQFRAAMPYALWAALESRVRQLCTVDDVSYAEQVTAMLWIRAEDCARVLTFLRERSDGRLTPEPLGESRRAV